MKRLFWKVLASLFLSATLILSPIQFAEAAPQVNYRTGLNGIVCLTIDDGYGRQYVKKVLDTLRAKGVHCTFFIIGSRLKPLADLWRQAIKDGHEICYHSMNHRSMLRWSRAAILRDIRQWNATARQVLGKDYAIPKLARLPGGSGHKNARIQGIFASIGYKLIYWSADTYTGVIRLSHRNMTSRIVRYIKAKAKPNAIILTHFNCFDSPALPKYIGWLKSHYKLGTVSEALAHPPASTTK